MPNPTLVIPISPSFITSLNQFMGNVQRFQVQAQNTLAVLPQPQITKAQSAVSLVFGRVNVLAKTMAKLAATMQRSFDRIFSIMGNFGKAFLRVLPWERLAAMLGPVGTALTFTAKITFGFISAGALVGKWLWDKMVGLGDSMLQDWLVSSGTLSSIGGLRSFRATFAGLPDDPNLFPNVMRTRLDATSRQFIARQVLGVASVKNTADLTVTMMLAAQKFMKSQRAGTELFMAEQFGLTTVFTPQFLTALQTMSIKELEEAAKLYDQRKAMFEIKEEYIQAWKDFTFQIKKAGVQIMSIFAEKLANPDSDFTKAFMNLSKAVVDFIKTILDITLKQETIDLIIHYMDKLSNWMKSDGPTITIKETIKEINEVFDALKIAKRALDEFGQIFGIKPITVEELPELDVTAPPPSILRVPSKDPRSRFPTTVSPFALPPRDTTTGPRAPTGPGGALQDQQDRPSRYTGTIELEGKEYPYGSGGIGRGSAPYGTYTITPGAIGPWGRAHGAIGIAGNKIWDPKLKDWREGIELHSADGDKLDQLYSAGCFAVSRSLWPEFKARLLDKIRREGPLSMTINRNGHIVISPLQKPVVPTTPPTPKPEQPSTQQTRPAPPQATPRPTVPATPRPTATPKPTPAAPRPTPTPTPEPTPGRGRIPQIGSQRLWQRNPSAASQPSNVPLPRARPEQPVAPTIEQGPPGPAFPRGIVTRAPLEDIRHIDVRPPVPTAGVPGLPGGPSGIMPLRPSGRPRDAAFTGDPFSAAGRPGAPGTPSGAFVQAPLTPSGRPRNAPFSSKIFYDPRTGEIVSAAGVPGAMGAQAGPSVNRAPLIPVTREGLPDLPVAPTIERGPPGPASPVSPVTRQPLGVPFGGNIVVRPPVTTAGVPGLVGGPAGPRGFGGRVAVNPPVSTAGVSGAVGGPSGERPFGGRIAVNPIEATAGRLGLPGGPSGIAAPRPSGRPRDTLFARDPTAGVPTRGLQGGPSGLTPSKGGMRQGPLQVVNAPTGVIPGAQVKPAGGVSALRADRIRFEQELNNDPQLREKVLRIMQNEQGRHPEGTLGVAETMMNRASSRNTPLEEAARWRNERGGYYQIGRAGTNAPINSEDRVTLERSLSQALGGSNTTDYATDNASGDWGRARIREGRFELRHEAGGEQFTVPSLREQPVNRRNWNTWQDRMQRGEVPVEAKKATVLPVRRVDDPDLKNMLDPNVTREAEGAWKPIEVKPATKDPDLTGMLSKDPMGPKPSPTPITQTTPSATPSTTRTPTGKEGGWKEEKVKPVQRDDLSDFLSKERTKLPGKDATVNPLRGGGRVTQVQSQQGATRSLPIDPRLESALDYAADKTGLRVKVTSGGQPTKGTPGAKRKGSIRHDEGKAADFDLMDEKGNILQRDDPRRLKFLEEASAAGAGGAGAGYMNDRLKIHMGITGARGKVGEGMGPYAGNKEEREAIERGIQRSGTFDKSQLEGRTAAERAKTQGFTPYQGGTSKVETLQNLKVTNQSDHDVLLDKRPLASHDGSPSSSEERKKAEKPIQKPEEKRKEKEDMGEGGGGGGMDESDPTGGGIGDSPA